MSRFPGISDDTPIYELVADAFLDDDTLHKAGEQIAYLGSPNEHMAPLNRAAEVRMREMLDHLEQCAMEKAQLVGRKYTGRLTDLGDIIAQATQDQKTLAERASAEAIKRAMPQPLSDKPVVGVQSQKTLDQRRQDTAAKTTVKAYGQPVQKGRAIQEPIHKMGGDRLTEKAPLEG